MNPLPPYKIFSLGDTALVIDFGNTIDESINKLVHSIFYQLNQKPIPGIIEAIPAYSSVTIYYDVLSMQKKINGRMTAYEWMSENLRIFLLEDRIEPETHENLVTVPVCYEKEYSPDINFIAGQNNISVEEIITLHTSAIYTVYMLGFLPGFAYMGEVNEKIACKRKLQPVFVEAGSVGIAGKQTGIYPLKSPGGWQIIGRTPLQLFDKEKENTTLFKAGDRVQFYSITPDEFVHFKNNPTLFQERDEE